MSKKSTHVIVGASLAGASAARALREHGFAGRIVLIGDEPELPYERPPLSKGYLLDKGERTKIAVDEPGWYDEQAIELRLGRSVAALDRAAREVRLDTGERIGYEKLLLATGSSPRRLDVPGAYLDGVHYLRRVDDSDRLRGVIGSGGRIVVTGAGWIGLEVAAAARESGCAVTVVEPQAVPLATALGTEMGTFFGDLHRRHGVDLLLERSVARIEGVDRVSGVVIDDGSELAADAVVVGIGAVPNVGLAQRAGLRCENGIVVDSSLRTEDPDIFAAGDVANAYHPFYESQLRTEHWANALYGAPVAAQAMLGQGSVYDRLPYFFTDQYDVGMEYCGWIGHRGYDRLVTRGDVDQRSFYAFWLTDDRVVAGMHVNRWDDGLNPVEQLIRRRKPVDPEQLADPSSPLTDQVMSG